MDVTSSLFQRIIKKQVTVGIVGMGYVGGALAEACSSAGYSTIGFDIDKKVVLRVNRQNKENILATTRGEFLKICDIICICVPTPINKDFTPNLSFFKAAIKTVGKFLTKGKMVIVESSITPGTIKSFAKPVLEETSKLLAGKDFLLAYSPERIDPGNTRFKFRQVPKVVSGIDEPSLKAAWQFYGSLVDQVVAVSSLEVAEMTKFLENVFRMVNISFINELSDYAKSKGIDILEVIKAASTKPFGFMPHYPGPGAGGDCIPVLSYYLLDDAKKKNVPLKVVEAAMKVNEERPQKIVEKVEMVLNGHLKPSPKKPRVLIVGVAYKAGSSNIRGSVSLKVWEEVEKRGVQISYHDPFVPRVNGHHSIPLTRKNILGADVIVIATDHQNIRYEKLVKFQKPIVDARNVLASYRLPHIIRI